MSPVNEEHNVDRVYLADSKPVDVRLNGESLLFPVWFKVEFKESGEVSAKVEGVRLATRFGDVINIHQTDQQRQHLLVRVTSDGDHQTLDTGRLEFGDPFTAAGSRTDDPGVARSRHTGHDRLGSGPT